MANKHDDLTDRTWFFVPQEDPDHPGFFWSNELKGIWSGLKVIAIDHVVFYLAPLTCVDMTGAIKVALAVVPGCTKIDTFAGDVPDTKYRLRDGKWEAFLPRYRGGNE